MLERVPAPDDLAVPLVLDDLVSHDFLCLAWCVGVRFAAVIALDLPSLCPSIEILTELSPVLPPIWASPDHLHVVWLNLLLNARDAIEEALREGWIRVSSFRRLDQVVIQVSDNGVGIDPGQLNQIYDPFFTTKPPGKGTGLGLFTCYRTVHRHGGEINVDSQIGIGTSFDVVLPITQVPVSGE